MMAKPSEGNAELLQELEALSETLYQSHNARRTASLILPRSANTNQTDAPDATVEQSNQRGVLEGGRSESRSRTRRTSMSPWRSRPSSKQKESDSNGGYDQRRHPSSGTQAATVEERKGIWNWKPIRALSHISMQKMGCLFSVEVIAIQALPASMNGLRLSVSVRKKEMKDGAVQTMPARVLQGAADFEETMFIQCNVYYSGGSSPGKPIKFEPRPFYISVVAIEVPELNLGKNSIDLSLLVKESMEKNLEGARVRQWERSFRLAGKAKGGELVVKLGFQIMEEGGAGIYSDQAGRRTPMMSTGKQSPSVSRKQSKSSFSITSPRTPGKLEFPTTPSKSVTPTVDFKEIDDFKLDEPATTPSTSSVPAPPQLEVIKVEDHEFPDFDVVDKGIEVEDEGKPEKEQQRPGEQEEKVEAKSASRVVVVNEVVEQKPAQRRRLSELDSIAKQLTALESMLSSDDVRDVASKNDLGFLETDDENATREFLQMLELEDKRFEFEQRNLQPDTPKSPGSANESDKLEDKSFVPDLGKGLGAVVRTKDGGYLVATNPFGDEVPRTETPKLAIQISKTLVLKTQKSATGFELFQRMAAMGSAKLGSQLLSMTSMDELIGKTSEQVAFEGIASAIVSRRYGEGANSSAATLVAKLKSMSTSMKTGRKERILTGIWTAGEEPVDAEELLSYTLQRIESMAVQALKIQADMAEEDAPFDVFPLAGKDDPNSPLSSAVTLEDWTKTKMGVASDLTVAVVVQTRDPLRRYEKVGAPVVAMVQAACVGNKEGAERYKVGSVHLGGMRTMVERGGGGGEWDGEKERLTAAQWLAACGLGRKGTVGLARTIARGRGGGSDLLWSLSSRVVADTWLEPTRNPDLKFRK